jgi:hypothetical protein
VGIPVELGKIPVDLRDRYSRNLLLIINLQSRILSQLPQHQKECSLLLETKLTKLVIECQ